MTAATTSETLNLAADLIEERGWGCGGFGWPTESRPDGALCLEGGIMAALGMRARAVGYGSIPTPTREFKECPAYIAVAAHLDTVPWVWNDDEGRTASEVIEVLRAAAAIERAREDAAAADMIALLSAPVTDAAILAEMGRA